MEAVHEGYNIKRTGRGVEDKMKQVHRNKRSTREWVLLLQKK